MQLPVGERFPSLEEYVGSSWERDYPAELTHLPPGQDFCLAAESLGGGEDALRYLYARALYDPYFSMHITYKGSRYLCECIPGHLFDLALAVDERGWAYGPRPASVMVVGRWLGVDEIAARQHFVGSTSQLFVRFLKQAGFEKDEVSRWYLTNLVKFMPPQPNTSAMPAAWVKDWLPVLYNELYRVQPDYLLLLGADAGRALLGKTFSLSKALGQVYDFEYQLPDGTTKKAKVVAAHHPAAVSRAPELSDTFANQIRLFHALVRGQPVSSQLGRYHYLLRADELAEVVREARSMERPVIAVDCEWDGPYPEADGAYLRTVQFSFRPGEAYCVVLHYRGGRPCFVPSIAAAVDLLRQLLCTDEVKNYHPRVGGHFFRADLPWLLHYGIDCREEYAPAESPELCRDYGGFDTGLMYHACEETASFKLEEMAAKLLHMPRYDAEKERWLAAYLKAEDISSKELSGYGDMPDWVLLPYAAADADVTRRLYDYFAKPGGMLDADKFGNNCWEAYWRAHRASLGFFEMEQTGLLVDRDRLRELITTFQATYDDLVDDFRKKIGWPDFNPGSDKQVIALLFGEGYLLSTNKEVLPPGVRSFGLRPVKDTNNEEWSDDKRGKVSPSCDKEALGILSHSNPLVKQLRDIRFIAHALSSALRPAEAGGRGLENMIRKDGRIHTRLSQTKETRRLSSSSPNLQNVSKRREDDYKRVLGYYE